ncbi:MAG: hypothetical protein FAZ92_02005 [Accumulibacter sp.]|nr:MAG: hypothetical protein FAZ92_02005 [Accumulibacter sp.]
MRDEDQRSLELLERGIERLDRFHVEVVGRFVHHQHVRPLQHQPAEDHPPLLATGDDAYRLLHLVAREQQAAEGAADQRRQIVALVGAAAGVAGDPVGQAEIAVEVQRVVLRVVARARLLGPLDAAALRLQFAQQQLQQSRLADAVLADDRQTLTSVEAEVELAEDWPLGTVIGESEILDLDRLPVQLLLVVELEADPRILARRRFDVLGFQFVDQLQARGGLFGLRCVRREAADEALQFGDPLLRLGVGALLSLPGLRRGLHEVVVVAWVDGDLAVIEVRHVRADLVEEVAIVRDDDHRAVALVDHVFQPADRADVEVVGRLVEEQDVRVGEQRLDQQDAQFPAGCDITHRAMVLRCRNADAEQQFAGARLGAVATVLGKTGFEVGGVHVVGLGGIRVGVDGVLLEHAGPHFLMSHHDDVDHPLLLEGELVLAQVGQAFVDVLGDVAGSRLEFACQDLHEGRLARAVGADQSIAIALAELEGDVLEQGAGPELHGDVVGYEHEGTSGRSDARKSGEKGWRWTAGGQRRGVQPRRPAASRVATGAAPGNAHRPAKAGNCTAGSSCPPA